jgi:hypothetical protein
MGVQTRRGGFADRQKLHLEIRPARRRGLGKLGNLVHFLPSILRAQSFLQSDVGFSRERESLQAYHRKTSRGNRMKYGEHLKANIAPEYGPEPYLQYDKMDRIISELSETKPSRYVHARENERNECQWEPILAGSSSQSMSSPSLIFPTHPRVLSLLRDSVFVCVPFDDHSSPVPLKRTVS